MRPDVASTRRLANPRARVSELSAITADVFHREFFARNRPLVLRGGVGQWQAAHTWTDDAHLARLAGDVSISYQVAAGREFDPAVQTHAATLAEFLELYRRSPSYYINDIDLPEPLAAELGTHELIDAFEELDDCRRARGFFLGAGGQFSDLHFDDVDLLYLVLDGQKVFWMFEPGELPRLYPREDAEQVFFSQIKLRDYRPAEFPEFQSALLYEVCLNPGDILYLPAHFWHAVETLGRSVAVSYVRIDRRSQLHTFIKLLKHDLLPISLEHKRRLLRMLAEPVADVEALAESLEHDDPYTLYLRLSLHYRQVRDTGGDTSRVERLFAEAKQRVREPLRTAAAHPTVRDLMNDLYRVDDESSLSGGVR